jgi:histone H3/H4
MKGISKASRKGRATLSPAVPDLSDIHMAARALAAESPLADVESPALRAESIYIANEPSRLLPLLPVTRIMRKHLTPNTKVSKDAALLLQDAATEFICFIAAEARDLSIADGRRSITPRDALASMIKLDFEEDAHVLQCWMRNRSASSKPAATS